MTTWLWFFLTKACTANKLIFLRIEEPLRSPLGIPNASQILVSPYYDTPAKYIVHLSGFTLRPETFENLTNWFHRTITNPKSPWQKSNKSSVKAKWVIWLLLHLGWNLNWWLLCNDPKHLERYSRLSAKRKGDRGSPYLSPLAGGKGFVDFPFTTTKYETVVTQCIIHLTKVVGNPKTYNMDSKNDHSTES